MTRALCLTIGLLLLTLPVLAHDPFIEDHDWGGFEEPFVVTDAAISYALYGYLDDDDVDVFQLDFAEAGELLRVEVLTPVCGEHYVDFQPQFVIVAPTDAVFEPLEVELPFDLPEETAILHASFDPALVAEATPEPRTTFIEPFGGTAFYQGEKIDLEAPTAGAYWIVVFNPDGISGDYTLATGYREVFNSPRDQVMTNVRAIQSGEWLHRRCDLPPDDPDAVIEHEHDH
jgi:hypothetical protein